jgi:hypothetical protein
LPEFVAVVYPYAVENAADETGLDRRLFPVVCSYRIEQVLDPVFLPGER